MNHTIQQRLHMRDFKHLCKKKPRPAPIQRNRFFEGVCWAVKIEVGAACLAGIGFLVVRAFQ